VRFVHTIEARKTTLRLDKLLDVLTVLGPRLEIERGTQPASARTSSRRGPNRH